MDELLAIMAVEQQAWGRVLEARRMVDVAVAAGDVAGWPEMVRQFSAAMIDYGGVLQGDISERFARRERP